MASERARSRRLGGLRSRDEPGRGPFPAADALSLTAIGRISINSMRTHMNRFLFLPVCFALITDAYAQGTVLFYNHVPTIGLDAPVFDVGGQSFLAGWPFYAQL